ncbi:MAG: hypothetical protein ACLT4C_01830 [Butyricicoccus sp.]
MVRQINRWGIMDTTGKLLTAPTYYYLSWARACSGPQRGRFGFAWMRAAACLTALSYISGFSELRYGLSCTTPQTVRSSSSARTAALQHPLKRRRTRPF